MSEEKLRVLYVSPTFSNDGFGQLVDQSMRAAASNLNFDLVIEHSTLIQGFSPKDLTILLDAHKPQYLICDYIRGSRYLIEEANKRGVYSYVIGSEIPTNDLKILGSPRDRLRHWLGAMSPDDRLAGALLTNFLVNQQREEQPNKPLEIIAFNGHYHNGNALNRRKGLEQAANRSGATVKQVFSKSWNPELATQALLPSMKRYPNASIYWAASDAIAISIEKQLSAIDKIPQKDFFIGGVDWSEEGLQSIAKQKLSASAGGHFLEGAWVMVLFHDHAKGVNISQIPTEIRSPMYLATADNIKEVKGLIDNKFWSGIDFKEYSKYYYPLNSRYNFTITPWVSNHLVEDRPEP